jgi:glycosyltransferase involved in cell wall biosynthesis
VKPRVAVFSERFLPYSQTFVYDELRAHARYEAHVFCGRRLNDDRFPYQPVFSGGRWFEYTRSAPALDQRLSDGGYTLLHAHFGGGGIYALPFARRHRLPLVVTFHGYDVPLLGSGERLYPKYWAYGLLAPAVLREMTLGLCASVELYELLRELGVPEARLRVHTLGIDVDRFAPGARVDEASREPVIVMAGRFVPKKGHVYGVRAFAQARRRSGRGRLILIGEGELRPRLEQLVREEQVAAHVTFAGALPHERIAALLGTATVLLAPSVTTVDGDRESGTLVVKEASAAGAIPIVTWHGGHPEIVEDGRTGFLVPERRVDAMAARLEQVLGDAALRDRLRAAGRAKMVAECDNRRRVAALEQAYDDAIATFRASHGRPAASAR